MQACPHTLALAPWIWILTTCCLITPRVKGSLSLSAICLQKRYNVPSQFRDGIDADAFGGVGCTDKTSQIGQHSVSHFCLCWKHLQGTYYISICLQVHLHPGCFAY